MQLNETIVHIERVNAVSCVPVIVSDLQTINSMDIVIATIHIQRMEAYISLKQTIIRLYLIFNNHIFNLIFNLVNVVTTYSVETNKNVSLYNRNFRFISLISKASKLTMQLIKKNR